MAEYQKPLPVVTVTDRPYWEGLRKHEIKVQKCKDCESLCFPPARTCPRCLSDRLDWVSIDGSGRVWTFTIFHKPYFRGFADEMPYNVAIVELDAGIRVFTNIVGLDNSKLAIGMAVRPYFDDVTDEVTLLKFRPEAS